MFELTVIIIAIGIVMGIIVSGFTCSELISDLRIGNYTSKATQISAIIVTGTWFVASVYALIYVLTYIEVVR